MKEMYTIRERSAAIKQKINLKYEDRIEKMMNSDMDFGDLDEERLKKMLEKSKRRPIYPNVEESDFAGLYNERGKLEYLHEINNA